jgi:hypothetical protein
VRKPIVNTAVEKAAISEDVIAEVIVVESTLENVETKSIMDQVFKKIQKNEVKKSNNMSKKLTDKEKKEKAKKKAKQAAAKAKLKEKEKKAKKKKKEKAKKEKAKMKLKAKKKAKSKKK